MKYRSLGTVGTASGRGIAITGATNATPIVLTLPAGHRQRNGDRVGIAGVTGNTGANGDFTLVAVGATAATLAGAVGNGAYGAGGGLAVGALMDSTPFFPRRAAVFQFNDSPGSAVFVGTVFIEGADQIKADSTNFQYNDLTTGVLTDGWRSALKAGDVALPAATAGGGGMVEVDLARYMSMRATWTSGGVGGGLFND